MKDWITQNAKAFTALIVSILSWLGTRYALHLDANTEMLIASAVVSLAVYLVPNAKPSPPVARKPTPQDDIPTPPIERSPTNSPRMRGAFLGLAPIALLAALAMGAACTPSTAPILNTVLLVLEDGSQVLDAIDSIATIFFLSKPDASLQQKYEAAMGKCRVALDACTRAAQGVQNASNDQLDQAFAQFQQAYQELTDLLQTAGIATKGVAGNLMAIPGGAVPVSPVNVSPPVAMKWNHGHVQP